MIISKKWLECENRLHLQISILYLITAIYFIWLLWWALSGKFGETIFERFNDLFNKDHRTLGLSPMVIKTLLFAVLCFTVYSFYIIYGNKDKDEKKVEIKKRLLEATMGGLTALTIAVLGELGLWIAPFFIVSFLLLTDILGEVVL